MTQLTIQGEAAAAPVETEGQAMALVRMAIEQKVPVEVLERLVALQERVTERSAEMAMAQALAAFQAECPPVPRVSKATVMKNGAKAYEYHFAPLEEIVRVIRPCLTAHGLSYTHDARVESGAVEITCTLQHVEGAKRSAKFTGPVDNSGGKNPLQGVGSARSYGRRYTLIDVLGLTTEEDDDGVGAHRQSEPPETITDKQAADLDALIDEVGADRAKFLRWLRVESLSQLTEPDLPRAIAALERKRQA